jgi:hypothetical protein
MTNDEDENYWPVYAWNADTKTVTECTKYLSKDADLLSYDLNDKYCVDTNFRNNPNNRYGMWAEVPEEERTHSMYKWQHIPFDQFPNEFKTHLLLLGIQ